MALFKEVKSLQLIPAYLVQPLKANASAHLAMSQVDLLARLLRDLDTESSGFTVDNVMKVSLPHAVRHRPQLQSVEQGHVTRTWGAAGVFLLFLP